MFERLKKAFGMRSEAVNLNGEPIRRLEFSRREYATVGDYADRQSLYLDRQTGELIPNTEIIVDGKLLMKINALGCKGEDIDAARPTVVCFGDSTTFGVRRTSWAQMTKIPGVQVLNAGVEGHPMDRVLERFNELKGRVNLVGAVVFTGWHNLIYNDHSEEYWRRMLDSFEGVPVIAHLTLATSLIGDAVVRGIDELIAKGSIEDNTEYMQWGGLEPTPENLREVLLSVNRFNMFIKKYCNEKNRLLIDLASQFRVSTYDDIPRWHFDPCHLRPSTYPKVAAFMAENLNERIGLVLAERGIDVDPDEAARQENPAPEDEKTEIGDRLYPLW